MDNISRFRWALGYALITLMQLNQVFGQSHIAPQEVIKVTDSETSGLSPSRIDNDNRPAEVETGIEFLENLEFELDEDLRFGTNPYGAAWRMHNNATDVWDTVQLFLRKLKGLPQTSIGKYDI